MENELLPSSSQLQGNSLTGWNAAFVVKVERPSPPPSPPLVPPENYFSDVVNHGPFLASIKTEFVTTEDLISSCHESSNQSFYDQQSLCADIRPHVVGLTTTKQCSSPEKDTKQDNSCPLLSSYYKLKRNAEFALKPTAQSLCGKPTPPTIVAELKSSRPPEKDIQQGDCNSLLASYYKLKRNSDTAVKPTTQSFHVYGKPTPPTIATELKPYRIPETEIQQGNCNSLEQISLSPSSQEIQVTKNSVCEDVKPLITVLDTKSLENNKKQDGCNLFEKSSLLSSPQNFHLTQNSDTLFDQLLCDDIKPNITELQNKPYPPEIEKIQDNCNLFKNNSLLSSPLNFHVKQNSEALFEQLLSVDLKPHMIVPENKHHPPEKDKIEDNCDFFERLSSPQNFHVNQNSETQFEQLLCDDLKPDIVVQETEHHPLKKEMVEENCNFFETLSSPQNCHVNQNSEAQFEQLLCDDLKPHIIHDPKHYPPDKEMIEDNCIKSEKSSLLSSPLDFHVVQNPGIQTEQLLCGDLKPHLIVLETKPHVYPEKMIMQDDLRINETLNQNPSRVNRRKQVFEKLREELPEEVPIKPARVVTKYYSRGEYNKRRVVPEELTVEWQNISFKCHKTYSRAKHNTDSDDNELSSKCDFCRKHCAKGTCRPSL